jgi:TRAP-type C4-dicarboxylate transport system permease small subunit
MLVTLRAGFDRALQWLAIALTVALLTVVMLGVITRALGEPLIWTDEISRFLMVWVAVAGWLLATRRRAHIRIRFFQDMLPQRAWRGAEIVIQCGIIALGMMLAWYGVDIVERNRDMEALSLPISLAWMYVPIVIAGLVTAAQATGEILERPRDGRSPPAPIVDGAA